jgi:uncharacterized protein (DUF1330 family)
MAAYVIGRVNVTNPDAYGEYTKRSPGAIEANGGKFIARGGAVETLEGEEETRRMVIVEFPSFEQAKVFYDSEIYRDARSYREGAAEMQFVIVDGV